MGLSYMDKVVKEKSITNDILKYLKTVEHCFAFKEHGGMYGTAGIPDIICCINGNFLAIEVKRPGGKVTKLQNKTISKIIASGGIAIVAFSVNDVEKAISKLLI